MRGAFWNVCTQLPLWCYVSPFSIATTYFSRCPDSAWEKFSKGNLSQISPEHLQIRRLAIPAIIAINIPLALMICTITHSGRRTSTLLEKYLNTSHTASLVLRIHYNFSLKQTVFKGVADLKMVDGLFFKFSIVLSSFNSLRFSPPFNAPTILLNKIPFLWVIQCRIFGWFHIIWLVPSYAWINIMRHE